MRLILAVAVASCGCGKREPDTRAAPEPERVERVAPPTPLAAREGRPSDPALAPEEGTFEVVAPAPAAAGVTTTARVRIVAGTGFHINAGYPLAVQLAPGAGVTAAKGELEPNGEREVTIPISVTPAAAGHHAVTGTVRFGICKRDACLSREMPVTFDVIAT